MSVYVVYECMCVHALRGVKLLLKGVNFRPDLRFIWQGDTEVTLQWIHRLM